MAEFRGLLEREKYDRVFLLGDYIGDLLGYCSVEDGNEVLSIVRGLIGSSDSEPWQPPKNIVIKGNHEAMCCAEMGKGHEEYLSLMRSMPVDAYTQVDGFSVYMAHDPDQLEPNKFSRANIVLTGHLHSSGMKKEGGDRLEVRLGAFMDGGQNPELAAMLHSLGSDTTSGRVYAIMDTDEMLFRIYQGDNIIRETTLFPRLV